MMRLLTVMAGFLKDAVSAVVYLALLVQGKKPDVVLVYHSVGATEPRADPFRLTVSPDNFRRHLGIIARSGRTVAVTFDDGYGDNFENAFPILKEAGIRAAFFITTDFINGAIDSSRFGGKGFRKRPLTWDEIKAMDRAGMEIGSHCLSHSRLAGLSEEAIMKEAGGSKRLIEEALGHTISAFSYPYGNAGSFNEATGRILKALGYQRVYTNIMGPDNSVSDPLRIHRIRIYSTDNGLRFTMKIAGAYAWVDRLLS